MSEFSYQIMHEHCCIVKGKGVLNGTTYSGHPLCTTLGNTTRSWTYHLFGIFRNRGALGLNVF